MGKFLQRLHDCGVENVGAPEHGNFAGMLASVFWQNRVQRRDEEHEVRISLGLPCQPWRHCNWWSEAVCKHFGTVLRAVAPLDSADISRVLELVHVEEAALSQGKPVQVSHVGRPGLKIQEASCSQRRLR